MSRVSVDPGLEMLGSSLKLPGPGPGPRTDQLIEAALKDNTNDRFSPISKRKKVSLPVIREGKKWIPSDF